MKSDRKTLEEKQASIPSVLLWAVPLIDLLLFIAWLIFSLMLKNPSKFILENFDDMLISIVSVTTLIFGFPFIKRYYTQSYRHKKIEDAIRENLERHKNERDAIYDAVRKMQGTKGVNSESLFIDIIFLLQADDDFTFYMAWNNYNYYHEVSRRRSEKNYKHYLLVENYIYNRVYEKTNSNVLETDEDKNCK